MARRRLPLRISSLVPYTPDAFMWRAERPRHAVAGYRGDGCGPSGARPSHRYSYSHAEHRGNRPGCRCSNAHLCTTEPTSTNTPSPTPHVAATVEASIAATITAIPTEHADSYADTNSHTHADTNSRCLPSRRHQLWCPPSRRRRYPLSPTHQPQHPRPPTHQPRRRPQRCCLLRHLRPRLPRCADYPRQTPTRQRRLRPRRCCPLRHRQRLPTNAYRPPRQYQPSRLRLSPHRRRFRRQHLFRRPASLTWLRLPG